MRTLYAFLLFASGCYLTVLAGVFDARGLTTAALVAVVTAIGCVWLMLREARRAR
ncbi:MAG TPA: hypothetical protein VG452_13060 [Egibacteraceae bacterium]|nr:hypothetical protein [Actinomycetota bacterium]HWB73138.1 hypothetical protein [Egibacteraceae bacterium]